MDRDAVAAIAALDDDVRRALFEHVRAAGRPVTRDDAAGAVGVSRNLAAFHLDKLVDLGLLRSGFAGGRARRVGRAPRQYEPTNTEISVQVPARSPELLAAILVDVLADTAADDPARAAAAASARRRGARFAEGARHRHARPGRLGVDRAMRIAATVLEDEGFEPYEEDGAIRLRNCPFHPLARQAPEFVCGLNREYLDGVVTGLGAQGCLSVELAPREGECCVRLYPRATRVGNRPGR